MRAAGGSNRKKVFSVIFYFAYMSGCENKNYSTFTFFINFFPAFFFDVFFDDSSFFKKLLHAYFQHLLGPFSKEYLATYRQVGRKERDWR